jgi:hypothetical protein
LVVAFKSNFLEKNQFFVKILFFNINQPYSACKSDNIKPHPLSFVRNKKKELMFQVYFKNEVADIKNE